MVNNNENLKLKFLLNSSIDIQPIQNGALYIHNLDDGTATGVPSFYDISIDINDIRYRLIQNQLREPRNGDKLYFIKNGLAVSTTNNVVNFDSPVFENEVNGSNIFAFGKGLKANHSNQFIIGQYNANNSDSVVEIGNGTADDKRSNLLRITEDGNIYLGKGKDNCDINATFIKFYNDSIKTMLSSYGLSVGGMHLRQNLLEFTEYAANIIGPEFSQLKISIDPGIMDVISPYILFDSSSSENDIPSLSLGAPDLSVLAKAIKDTETPLLRMGVEMPTSNNNSEILFQKEMISLTANKIQFNCDKENIVDKEGNSLITSSDYEVISSSLPVLADDENKTLYYQRHEIGMVIAKIELKNSTSPTRTIKISKKNQNIFKSFNGNFPIVSTSFSHDSTYDITLKQYPKITEDDDYYILTYTFYGLNSPAFKPTLVISWLDISRSLR